MRTRYALTLALAALVTITACGDDDGPAGPTNNPPTIVLTSPNGGQPIAPGSDVTIQWTATDDGVVQAVELSYTADGLASPVVIASGLAASGTYTWTVPNTPTFGVKVKAEATDDKGLKGSDESDAMFAIVTVSARGYAKSSVCAQCHQDQATKVANSGHPHKLTKVVNGQPPSYPYTTVPSPPTGYTWDAITYVIGGYNWKARFMDSEGYIITDGYNGVLSQYNLPRADLGGGLPEEWVSYHGTDPVRKPYTCGACHTTGWQSVADNGGVNQDGLPGIHGTWEEPGVHCEACHGPGGTHVATQAAADIVVDRSSEMCGSCHFRDSQHRIAASGGFIRHHEQYDEMISAKHVALTCVTCHDPHQGVEHGNEDLGGIKVSCESCHASEAQNNKHLQGFAGAPTCVDCHMARASKSARAVHAHQGDIHTHIFKILPDAVAASDPGGMFYDDAGTLVSRGYVTLDFACYGCHQDASDVGGSASRKTLAELSAKATGIHAPPPKPLP